MKYLYLILTVLTLSTPSLAKSGQEQSVHFPINNQNSIEFNAWCGRILDELHWAKMDSMSAYRIGNLDDALSILKVSLENVASQTFPYEVGSLSYQAIVRANSYVQRIESVSNGSEKDIRTLVLFLHKYIDYIFTVSEQLDVPYFNHRCNRGYCREDIGQIEEKFIQFAFGQVDNVLQTMTFVGNSGVFPIGSAKAFLQTLNQATSYAIQDLMSSVFAEYYSCSIRDLVLLESRLNAFNAHGRTQYWPTEVYAVRGSYYDADTIVRVDYQRCGRASVPARRVKTDLNAYDLLARKHSIRLYHGRTENIRLDQPHYVQKIIVTAEGINRHDGVFDVMVNGVIKGTIHFPGNDPSYVVTIAEHTDNIQFMSRSGSATISKVLIFSK